MLYFTLITFIFVGATKERIFLKEKNTETKQDMVKLKLQHLLSINKYSPGQKDTAEKFSNYAGGDLSKSHQNPQFCSSTEYWSSDNYILGLNVHLFTLVLRISVNCYLQRAKGTFLNRNLDASNQLTSKKFSYFNQCRESMV